MRIAICSTPAVTTLDGVECRVWEGVTETGVRVKVFVHRVAVAESADQEVFSKELAERLPPGVAVPLSLIL